MLLDKVPDAGLEEHEEEVGVVVRPRVAPGSSTAHNASKLFGVMKSASVAGRGMGRPPLVTLVKPSSSTYWQAPEMLLRLRPKMGMLAFSTFLMAPGFLSFLGQFADVCPVSLQSQQRRCAAMSRGFLHRFVG